MKIGIQGWFLIKPFTGIGQYTINLFRELAKIDSGNEYIILVPEKVDKNIIKGFPNNVFFNEIPFKKWGAAGIKKTWWEQISVPENFQKEKVDIAIFPYPCNPWTKDFYKKTIKTALTIHDCIPWTDKKYRKSLLSKMYHHQSKKAVKLANIIFTVSESSKKDTVNVCGVEAKKVHTVYNDASEIYKEKVGDGFADEVLRRFNLKKDKFFLYVGGYDERKNVKYLIGEFSNFARDHWEIPLVLAGGKLFSNKLYESYDHSLGSIVRTGFLDEKSLAALYQNCLSFVNFSKKEGFNIPILEAANCGAPLILSDISVHREITAGYGVFVDIERKGAGQKAMEKMLDEDFREKFVKESKELSGKFSWTCSAQKMKDVLFSK